MSEIAGYRQKLPGRLNAREASGAFFLDGNFLVPAELEAESREELVGEIGFAAGTETLIECGGEHRRGNGFVYCGCDGPAPFAGVGNAAGKLAEIGAGEQRDCGEIQKPGCYYAAATPDLGDIGEIQIVGIVFGMAQRRGFGVHHLLIFADVGVAGAGYSCPRRRRP